MPQENRQSERHRVRFHLVYDDGSSFNAGVVRDVSESGLFLETALPLPVGTVVTLTPLDENTSGDLFEVSAKVVRTVAYHDSGHSQEPPGMGLMFLDLSADERWSVVKMIRALEDRDASRRGNKDPFLGVRVPKDTQKPGPA